MLRSILFLSMAAFFVIAGTAQAGDVDVTNKVTVRAETGDNQGEKIKEGEARVYAEVQQSVNGVTLPPVVVSTSSEGGSAYASITAQTTGTTTQVITEVKTTKVITGQQTTNNKGSSNQGKSVPVEQALETQEGVEIAPDSLVVGFWGSVSGVVGSVFATLISSIYEALVNVFT